MVGDSVMLQQGKALQRILDSTYHREQVHFWSHSNNCLLLRWRSDDNTTLALKYFNTGEIGLISLDKISTALQSELPNDVQFKEFVLLVGVGAHYNNMTKYAEELPRLHELAEQAQRAPSLTHMRVQVLANEPTPQHFGVHGDYVSGDECASTCGNISGGWTARLPLFHDAARARNDSFLRTVNIYNVTDSLFFAHPAKCPGSMVNDCTHYSGAVAYVWNAILSARLKVAAWA